MYVYSEIIIKIIIKNKNKITEYRQQLKKFHYNNKLNLIENESKSVVIEK